MGYRVIIADALDGLRQLPEQSVNTCVTSPPYYGLRDYHAEGQIGQEDTPEEFIERLVAVFREVKRVLRDDGTLWVNMGDSYAGTGDKGQYQDPKNKNGRNGQAVSKTRCVSGCKPKDLIGIPWMLAFALRADGWYLRQDIIWAKPNPMPESVTDRCTKSHEYIFLLSKSPHYYFDGGGIAEPVADSTVSRLMQDVESQHGSERAVGKTNGTMKACVPRFGGSKYGDSEDGHFQTYSGNEYQPKPYRNKRDVWTVATKPYSGAHFAVFPDTLITPCVIAGCPKGGTVLDPFCGSGTTLLVAQRNGRNGIGIEINPDYEELIRARVEGLDDQNQMTFDFE